MWLTKGPATRQSSSSWRDPRLWLGVVLIVGSAGAGSSYAKSIGQRTVAFSVAHDVAAGTVIVADDVVEVHVAVPTSVSVVDALERIVGSVARRDLSVGDLVTEASLGVSVPVTTRIVCVPVRAGHMPSLDHGAVVEVWVTPSTQGMELPGPSRIVIPHAIVVAAPSSPDPTADSAVTLQIDVMDLAALNSAMRDGTLDVALIPTGQA